MKWLLILSIPAAMLCAADGPGKPAAKDVAAPAASAGRLEIPAGAREFAPYSYRYTDSAGKTWIYRKTPFGVARYEERHDAGPGAPADYPYMKATDAGDSVRFERKTPFGISRWERKKTELDDMERAAWERDRAAAQD